MTAQARPFADELRLPDHPDALEAHRSLDRAFATLESRLERLRPPRSGPHPRLQFEDPSRRTLRIDGDSAYPTVYLSPTASDTDVVLRLWRAPADLIHPRDAARARHADLVRRSGICLPRYLPRRPVTSTDLEALTAACRWASYVLRVTDPPHGPRKRRAG